MGSIRLEAVSKLFPNGVRAVDDVTLEIEEGEFMVLVGPSGCGKSTLLRMIAGLERVSSGRIVIGGADVTTREPRARDIAMVFQNYALYPHMNVRENLGFALRLRGNARDRIARRVGDVARPLGLDELLDRKPAALSGGQRQRVAMGRAIVREPEAFLMDEPLSNLDALLRVTMRAELVRLHRRLGVTTVYVTHDQIEAMTLGHRVAVLRDGVLQQCDTPQHLFRRPANVFVAGFMGSPPMNLVEATVDDGALHFAGFTVPLPARAEALRARGRVILGIRPTDLEPAEASAGPGLGVLRVRAEVVEDLGAEMHVVFPVAAPRPSLGGRAGSGDDDGQLLLEERSTLFTVRLDARNSPSVGDMIELAVHPDRLHLFDAATGEAAVVGGVPAG